MSNESVTHYIAPASHIRAISNIISIYTSKFKISKKNKDVNIFVSSEVDCEELHSKLQSLHIEISKCIGGCEMCDLSARRKKSNNVGSKYTVYPPLILLPTGTSDTDPNTKKLALELLNRHGNCTHVAINRPIMVDDRIRSPQIIPVIGNFGSFEATEYPEKQAFEAAFWASCIQNGIFQTWAPMYTMFSRGNITEKKRVLVSFADQAEIRDSTVVDLYSGIGYFTLSYAKHKPRKIYCWELNPWSIEGFLRAAKVNKIKARAVFNKERYVPDPKEDEVVVFAEDNQNAVNRIQDLNISDLSHINMGLLPHARDAIPIALKLSKSSQGSHKTIVHLHENVPVNQISDWRSNMSEEIGPCLHIEKIKEYSPGIFHLCGDFAIDSGRN